MKVVAFIMDYQVVDRIIDHLKLTLAAEKPPPSRVLEQVDLIAVEEQVDYYKGQLISRGERGLASFGRFSVVGDSDSPGQPPSRPLSRS